MLGAMKIKTLLLSNLFAVVVTGLLSGCATPNYDKSAGTAVALKQSSDLIAKGDVQIDVSLAALNDLLSNPQPDLRKQYDTFANSVDELSATSADVAAKTKDMKAQGAAYFAGWDQESAQIQNEDIRSRSETRRNEVAARFARISAQYDDARTAFQPYMSDLRDVQKFLSTDLTSGGLAAIKDPATKATADAVPLKELLNRLAVEFKGLGIAMSPRTPAS